MNRDGGIPSSDNVRNVFCKWAISTDIVRRFKDCAAKLVARRQERVDTHWCERINVKSEYKSPIFHREPGEFFDRASFVSHLNLQHYVPQNGIDSEADKCNKH